MSPQREPHALYRSGRGHDVPEPITGQKDELVLAVHFVLMDLGLCRNHVLSACSTGGQEYASLCTQEVGRVLGQVLAVPAARARSLLGCGAMSIVGP